MASNIEVTRIPLVEKKSIFKFPRAKNGRNIFTSKRQRFIFAVVLLSIALFISEYLFSSYGIIISLFLGFFTDVSFFIIMQSTHDSPSKQAYILPFLYSLSFGLFYFLVPSRLLTRSIVSSFYAIGLYSLFLSENIFTVASIRTIALLNGARIVSFVVTLISYFFMTNIIFSLHLGIIPTTILLYAATFLFITHSIWTYTLDISIKKDIAWVSILSLCLFELGAVLWFWPSSPTVVSVFLTGVLYIIVGLSHVWLDKRLFRGVLWEYIWVAILAFFIIILFTQWQ